MTTEGIGVVDTTAPQDDDRLFCYRHPDRETWVRCGRCDRPICTRCAMQGPVGFRCKSCGTLPNDPLRRVTPMQGALGLAISVGLGLVAGLIAGRLGLFAIFISFIAGGFIAEAVTRVIGWKRGPAMLAIVLGGIIAGHVLGAGAEYLLLLSELAALPVEVGEVPGFSASFFLDLLVWQLISAGAACVGAYSRLR